MFGSIVLDGVSKTFQLPHGSSQEIASIRALVNVTFALPSGGVLGIIGRNGAGKTTLLRILAGSIERDGGTIKVEGAVRAVPPKAQFDPESSARDAARTALLAYGIPQDDVASLLEMIEAIADIGASFDMPIRAYSTGMQTRLALAIAICQDPDVLLLDEVFAAGDEAFATKYLTLSTSARDPRRTVVLATHKMDLVEDWCTTAVWLDKGEIAGFGEPRAVVAAYRAYTTATPTQGAGR